MGARASKTRYEGISSWLNETILVFVKWLLSKVVLIKYQKPFKQMLFFLFILLHPILSTLQRLLILNICITLSAGCTVTESEPEEKKPYVLNCEFDDLHR